MIGCVVLLFCGLSCAVATYPAPGETAYNQDYAIRSVHLAGAAYCPEDVIMAWNSSDHSSHVPGFKPYRVVQDSSTAAFAFLGMDPQENNIVISFRGTVSSQLKAWITDLESWHSTSHFPSCGCQVHAGFNKAYDSVHPEILAALGELKGSFPSANIVVTGHSLGAALATLCAATLSTNYTISSVYTYGQPRVGDHTFSDWYRGRIPTHQRIVHHKDVVPHAPPQALGFYHTRREIYYNEDETSFKICDGSGEDSDCSDGLYFPTSVSNHLTYLNVSLGTDEC